MRSIFVTMIILWFCTRIVSVFRINVDNLTDTFDGTSFVMELSKNESEINQTIDYVERSNNNTYEFNEPSSTMDVIDAKPNISSIRLNHTVHQTSLVSSSREHMRGIIFKQKIKPEARSFFGLIIIPCECQVIESVLFLCFTHLMAFIFLQISFAFSRPRDSGHFIRQCYSIK